MPQPIELVTDVGEPRHAWIVKEYDQHDRSTRWYMIMGFLGLALIIIGLWTSNFLFSLIIILFGIILYLQAKQQPLEIDFVITDLGVIVGSRFYPYDRLENFYVLYDPPLTKKLLIETTGLMRPRISVPLDDQNPVAIRQTLREFLDEDLNQDEEPFSDAFGRFWKIH